MKKSILSVLAVLVLAATTSFASIPYQERPFLFASDMEIQDARFDFTRLSRVDLLMSDSPEMAESTGLTVSLYYQDVDGMMQPPRTVQLVITDVEDIGCGSKQYIASLPRNFDHLDGNKEMYHRFSVVLQDHTQRLCEDYRPYTWEADVREGYGWCGTMDATMTLRGNPKPIYTILHD